jgi:hypothetical protein
MGDERDKDHEAFGGGRHSNPASQVFAASFVYKTQAVHAIRDVGDKALG